MEPGGDAEQDHEPGVHKGELISPWAGWKRVLEEAWQGSASENTQLRGVERGSGIGDGRISEAMVEKAPRLDQLCP